MLIKLAALGALGFVGYSYLAKRTADMAPVRPAPETPDVRLAGGPLSSQATLQHDPDTPPVPPTA